MQNKNEKENFYYKKWMEEIRRNAALEAELTKFKKIYEYNKHFHKEHFRYKKCFEPLVIAYNDLLRYLQATKPLIDKVIKIYNKRLLLNPAFPKVKLSENEKNNLINETKIILQKYNKKLEPKTIIPQDLVKDFERKNKSQKIIMCKKENN